MVRSQQRSGLPEAEPSELKISRAAIEQHIRCPQCFYLQRKRGLKPPRMIPLTLAAATDSLLKNEFDAVREQGGEHPLWKLEGVRVRAYNHPEINVWRNFRKGIRVELPTGVEVYGAIDDVWENLDTKKLHIVDYKSTSSQADPSIDKEWG